MRGEAKPTDYAYTCARNRKIGLSWMKVQNLQNPELKKVKFQNMLYTYKKKIQVEMIVCLIVN